MSLSVCRARMWGQLRAVAGAVCGAGLASLAVVPAPTYRLWQLSVVVSEAGHALAVVYALAALWLWMRRRRLAALVCVASTATCLVPATTAYWRAGQVSQEIATAFGADVATAPLVWWGGDRDVTAGNTESVRRDTLTTGHDGQDLDVYRVGTPSELKPLLMVVEGGSWSSDESQSFRPFAEHEARRGWVVAVIRYRLAPQYQFPTQLEDVRAARDALLRAADTLAIDTKRIAMLGRSAGGQLALTAAYEWKALVRGVVAFYAPTDLFYSYQNPGNPRVIDGRAVLRAYLGGTPEERAPSYVAGSPLLRVDAEVPPTLLVHGRRDELVRFAQSLRLLDRLHALGRPAVLVDLPWATHACDYIAWGPCGRLSTWAVDRFLDAVTR